jgi:DNA-binding NtrC family response regulator
MSKRLLDVGSCGPDYAALMRVVQSRFDAIIVQAHSIASAIAALEQDRFDLVTINRLMDADGSPGLDIVQAIKSNERFAATPVMLITNFADYQTRAVDAGAVPGFGKNELHSDATIERLRPYLG